jgi:hypothetical protein
VLNGEAAVNTGKTLDHAKERNSEASLARDHPMQVLSDQLTI